MSVVLQVHGFLSNTIWMFFLGLGLWGVIRAVRQNGVDGSYLGGMVIGEILYTLQAILGIALLINGNRPVKTEMHLLYGAFAVVFLPGLFAYLRGDDTVRGQWVYGLGALFLCGIAFRAIGTAG